MDTETIFRTALVYAQYAGIEQDEGMPTSGDLMDQVIPKMLGDLLNLAEEYAVTVEWDHNGIRAYA